MSEEKFSQDEPLLRVEHLSMYFGHRSAEKKAVHDVSFDIKKGEVFSLVGESGCGKTTTGRTIIRLYDATSGSVYFKGRRIVAGTRAYTDEIKALNKEKKGLSATDPKLKKIETRIDELKDEIRKAKFDHKHGNEEWVKEELKRIEAEYQEAKKTSPARKLCS